ncbi:MAG: NUDIX hydrolase [Nevskia sp.]|nr:NUDIX hydrolase [Nevskia sp.]
MVFTIRDGALHVLLIERNGDPYKGFWALPGGFLEPDEDLEACACRELLEETGVSCRYLEQFHAFGAINRDPRERVITVAYFAVTYADIALKASSDAANAIWWPITRLPTLAFDHGDIILSARHQLTAKLDHSNIVIQFLREQFTMRDVQIAYETIVGAPQSDHKFDEQLLKMMTSGELAKSGELLAEDGSVSDTVYRLSQQ